MTEFELTRKQEKICEQLDLLYQKTGINHKSHPPSEIYKGAIFLMSDHDANPDWMAQAAHSLRELFYEFLDNRKIRLNEKTFQDAFNNIAAVSPDDFWEGMGVGRLFGLLSDIAHHKKDKHRNYNENTFKILVSELEEKIFLITQKQLDYHTNLKTFIDDWKAISQPVNLDKYLVNIDSRNYFFDNAKPEMLMWLWVHGFLDVLKATRLENVSMYKPAELMYLQRSAEENPHAVVDIILRIDTSNPDLDLNTISTFASIASKLKAPELARLIPKIEKDGWIKRVSGFNHWGIDYAHMLKTLRNDPGHLIQLAESVLSVKSKDEVEKDKEGKFYSYRENPFYFQDFSLLPVFHYLLKLDNKYTDEVLALLRRVLIKILFLSREDDEITGFDFGSGYLSLYDADLFVMELQNEEQRRRSHRDTEHDLAAILTLLLKRKFETNCGDMQKFYAEFFAEMPNSRFVYKLRLFVTTLCKEQMRGELKELLFEIFEYPEHPWGFLAGAEYRKALKVLFSIMTEDEKAEYVNKLLAEFGKQREEDTHHKQSAATILMVVREHLSEKQKKEAQNILGFDVDRKFEPTPSIIIGDDGNGRFVEDEAPVTKEMFEKLSIVKIIEKIKSEWTPEQLKKMCEGKSHFDSINARGVGDLITEDLKRRFNEYIKYSREFFNKEHIHPEYTYAFLQGVSQNVANADKDTHWGAFVSLVTSITDDGDFTEIDSESKGFGWLGNWRSVHRSMAEALKKVFKETKSELLQDTQNRVRLLRALKYLLSHKDPTKESEICKLYGAEDFNRAGEYDCSDPLTHAINSVRGVAYDALMHFIENDPQKSITPDVQEVLLHIFENEETRAIRFLFGHYLPFLYSRNKEFVLTKLVPLMFDDSDMEMYLAAWEGYLSTNLYLDLFTDLQTYYMKALGLRAEEYTRRKYWKDLDEGIATHIALAYLHYDQFGLGSDLLKKFWSSKNTQRLNAFVRFIGNYTLSTNNPKSFAVEKKVKVERIRELWNWMLDNSEEFNKEVFTRFGYWINGSEENLLDDKYLVGNIEKTLELTGGVISWDHGFVHKVSDFAKLDPERTLKIIDLYLKGLLLAEGSGVYVLYKDHITKAIESILKEGSLKENIIDMVNNVLKASGEHSREFWFLEEIIRKHDKEGS